MARTDDWDTWKQRLKKRREGKDRFFREDPRSPIPASEADGFTGLRYYPPDPDYHLRLELYEHEPKEPVRVDVTRGEPRDLVRWGEFRFRLGGEDRTLQAYRSDPDAERLFVPFRDATAGDETYELGRYLDLEPQLHRVADRWILDFNEAYNPWCAYSDQYSCVVPPRENELDVPVRAGEKRYE
ncbi:MAG: DUF1684 domain-containing protein [Gemmatimonadota bacterium]